ncbi:hypothetical protein COCON_G00133700 [Conger conger]|uniref:Cyclic GMP-AMP synthase n=1 Tax=Conger conger TaxID=82655 RepID=A0A9Q1DEC0_CONCO|nr:cyclic GMP-AMP synthase [Conger conger]XP_061111592.1 cyclic GMP-AMP synthase [Conger conger]XP_061111593.1 cyclic GMP-AMP synthase [Conger conger]XP_061111594.1 cyclic GMP-AMP synthase [Conger conger]XP_061111595.1 cyclic GMP-AMP synthase [Conger conger]XP_061111597.1 cyclic GMP-AMP synthase [Conger conger]KAJ8268198.1 hypothetical protein COCON_G00133700 [Conger conger]
MMAAVAQADENAPAVAPHLHERIRNRVNQLGLRRTELQQTAKRVNDLRDGLLDFLKKNTKQPFLRSVTVLNSGSYYETVKISNPNEFDIMLLLPTPRLTWVELEEYHGLHYSVSLTRPTRSEIQAFLLADGLTISASKVLNEMRALIRNFLSTYKVPEGDGRWVLNRKRPSSPAVTLSLMCNSQDGKEEGELLSLDIVPTLEVPEAQAWPLAAQQGLKVDNWLGKKARRNLTKQCFYFVPKKPAGRNLSESAKESWRISFSHIEKELIKNHGQARTCCEGRATKCCRKKCLMLLKFLIERLKTRFPEELDRLCSYHGKTAFLHTLCRRGHDSQWAPSDLPSNFMALLLALEGHVSSGQLPHFFVPTCNLFAAPAFPRKALSCLQRALEEQMKLGLPLFQLPKPAPPLALNPNPSQPPPGTQGDLSIGLMFASIAALLCFLSVVAYSVK